MFRLYTVSPQQMKEMGKPYYIAFDDNIMVVALRNGSVLVLNFAAP